MNNYTVCEAARNTAWYSGVSTALNAVEHSVKNAVWYLVWYSVEHSACISVENFVWQSAKDYFKINK